MNEESKEDEVPPEPLRSHTMIVRRGYQVPDEYLPMGHLIEGISKVCNEMEEGTTCSTVTSALATVLCATMSTYLVGEDEDFKMTVINELLRGLKEAIVLQVRAFEMEGSDDSST